MPLAHPALRQNRHVSQRSVILSFHSFEEGDGSSDGFGVGALATVCGTLFPKHGYDFGYPKVYADGTSVIFQLQCGDSVN